VKELLEGRRLGFALRPLFGGVALGLGLGVTILDLMTWFGWGTRVTNPLVTGSVWLAAAAAVVAAVAVATAVAEMTDAPEDDRALARLDVIGVAVAVLLYAASAALRTLDPGAAAPAPPAFLLALAGLVVLVAGAAMASLLYAAREWEEVEDIAHVPQRRRRRAS
jgi:uncharacterized membrane protein